MANPQDEGRVLGHIEQLVAEEHRLFGKGALDEAETKRLAAINVELDRYWDLLRQRRAARETGHDPAAAHLRPAGTVENYEG
jgi:Protein of unknown function (DUF2630)